MSSPAIVRSIPMGKSLPFLASNFFWPVGLCDDNENGINNYDEWGYGAYNLYLEDVGNDYGMQLYLTFNKSSIYY